MQFAWSAEMMLTNTSRIVVCLGAVIWTAGFPTLDVVATDQARAAQTKTDRDVASPEPQKTIPLVSGKIVNEKGQAIDDARLILVFAEDPSVKATASVDDVGGFTITKLPSDAVGELWKIGSVGASDYLPVALTIESFDSTGTSVERLEVPEYVPEVPMPSFRIAADGSVKIRVVMGAKTEVAARWKEARRTAREAGQQDRQAGQPTIATDASAGWSAGNKKFNQMDFAGALADYDAALEVAPDEPGLLSARASTLFQLGRYEEARRSAEEALRVGGSDIQLLLALVDRFNKAGDTANARGVLEVLRVAAPDAAELPIQTARLSLREGDVNGAVAAYREATRRSPENLKLWNEMANACREAGHKACAVEAYGTLVKLDPGYDKTAYYFLGTFSEGPKAIEYFEKAATYLPEAYIKLCSAYRDAGQSDKAIAACRRYLEAKPEGAQAEQVKELLQSLEP